MGKQRDRYKAWREAQTAAWLNGDVEASMEGWAQGCTRIGVDPFGDHWTVQGREALRELFESVAANWSNKKLIESKVLSANKERGILHTWLSWTSGEGKEMACTYISIINLDEQNKCTEYREWNVVKGKEDEAGNAD